MGGRRWRIWIDKEGERERECRPRKTKGEMHTLVYGEWGITAFMSSKSVYIAFHFLEKDAGLVIDREMAR